jgi:hypothetical protein
MLSILIENYLLLYVCLNTSTKDLAFSTLRNPNFQLLFNFKITSSLTPFQSLDPFQLPQHLIMQDITFTTSNPNHCEGEKCQIVQ